MLSIACSLTGLRREPTSLMTSLGIQNGLTLQIHKLQRNVTTILQKLHIKTDTWRLFHLRYRSGASGEAPSSRGAFEDRSYRLHRFFSRGGTNLSDMQEH